MTEPDPIPVSDIPDRDLDWSDMETQNLFALPPPRSPSGRLLLEAEEHPAGAPFWLRPMLALDRWLGHVELGTLILLTTAMIAVGVLQVIMRDVFQTGLQWADVFLRHTVLWAGLLGASATTQAGRHLCVDAVIRTLPQGVQRVVGIALNLTAFLVCVLLTLVAITFVRQEHQAGGEVLFWGLSRWQLQFIFPAAFALMAYRFLLAAFEEIAGRSPAPEHGPAA